MSGDERPGAAGKHRWWVACAAVGIVLFIAGFVELSVCGAGLSLVLFGASIFAFGAGMYAYAGRIVLWMGAWNAFILVVTGLILGHTAGCPY